MDEQRVNLEKEFADIVTEEPYEFTVGRKLFRLYPVTLAKTFVLRRVMDGLGIDWSLLRVNPFLEALRLVELHRKACCEVIAVHTAPNTYKDLFNSHAMATRRNVFLTMNDKAIAKLLLLTLTSDKTDSVIRGYELDKERERLQKAIDVKETKNSPSFGGKTILGTFIAQLMEMGFSHDEILYERSYSFLRLMLADKVVSLYLSDKEQEKLPPDIGGSVLDGNDPASFTKLKSFLARKGMQIK